MYDSVRKEIKIIYFYFLPEKSENQGQGIVFCLGC